jgi:hypothetical protein
MFGWSGVHCSLLPVQSEDFRVWQERAVAAIFGSQELRRQLEETCRRAANLPRIVISSDMPHSTL